ncbi:MAG: hypothetical protein R3B90_04065 [Planctomycetaceae bacterium]
MHTREKVQKRFTNAELQRPYKPREVSAWLDYRDTLGMRLTLPDNASDTISAWLERPSSSRSPAVKRPSSSCDHWNATEPPRSSIPIPKPGSSATAAITASQPVSGNSP